jgi:hypothetical protein
MPRSRRMSASEHEAEHEIEMSEWLESGREAEAREMGRHKRIDEAEGRELVESEESLGQGEDWKSKRRG